MLPLDGAFFGARRMPKAALCTFSTSGPWAPAERKQVVERLPDLELAGPVDRLQSDFVNGIKALPDRPGS